MTASIRPPIPISVSDMQMPEGVRSESTEGKIIRAHNDLVRQVGLLAQRIVDGHGGLPKGHEATHLVGGTDALQTPAAPVTVTVGGTASVGTGPAYMRENAQLTVAGATPTGLANTNTAGTATTALRGDAKFKRDLRVFVDGVELATRNALNFTAASATVTDDAGNDWIKVVPTGGGGGGSAAVLGQPTGTLSRTYTFTGSTNSWTVSGAGILTNVSNRLRIDGNGGLATALEPSGAGNVADGEIEFQYRSISNASLGVVFRATDATNNYLFLANPSVTDVVKLDKYVAGVITQIGANGPTCPMREATDLTYKVLVRFVGGKIDLYVNEAWCYSMADTTWTTGIIGIFTNAGICEVDDVKVYTIP